jgi:hypothetical protein
MLLTAPQAQCRMNDDRAAADKHEVAITRCGMNIRRTIAILVLASSLAGCDAVDLISKGMSYSNAVAADLERATGVKPGVGFNWHNGGLQSVTVTFPKVYLGQPAR